MRAISLWQPWATAVALGSKRIETRHWSTSYRGPLAIHAAQRCNKSELRMWYACRYWKGALQGAFGEPLSSADMLINGLPFGALVAVVDLVDVRTFSLSDELLNTPRSHALWAHDPGYNWTELQMGFYGPDRYGWMLENARPLKAPIPFKGRQGFFNVPEELLSEAL